MQDLRGGTGLITASRIIADQEARGPAIRVQVSRTRGEFGELGSLGLDVLLTDASTARFLAAMFTRAAERLDMGAARRGHANGLGVDEPCDTNEENYR